MAADFAMLRQRMVDGQIRTVDVTNLGVLAAFLTVPREKFVPENLRELSYTDEAIPLTASRAGGRGRYLMKPAALAKLLQAADIKSDDVVLDIGAGTGYSAALLSKLASSVIALEEDEKLAANANENLQNGSYDNVVVVSGPLTKGYAEESPFDVILLEGAVDFIPETLFAQLREGGRLLAAEGHGNSAVARVYMKEDGVVSARRLFNLAINPLEGFVKTPEFVF